jgi:hypothetical protein
MGHQQTTPGIGIPSVHCQTAAQGMGIERDNQDKRQDWVLARLPSIRRARLRDHYTYDRALDGSDDTPFDCGAVATALVNAAWSRGLGAVINSQGIMQSPVVREHSGIADDQVIMKSIALGWPDENFPANAVVSERKSVEEGTVFVGFEKLGRRPRATGVDDSSSLEVVSNNNFVHCHRNLLAL